MQNFSQGFIYLIFFYLAYNHFYKISNYWSLLLRCYFLLFHLILHNLIFYPWVLVLDKGKPLHLPLFLAFNSYPISHCFCDGHAKKYKGSKFHTLRPVAADAVLEVIVSGGADNINRIVKCRSRCNLGFRDYLDRILLW